MNLSRLAIATVVAFVVDQIYGFLVWGTLLEPEFARYPAVFRSKDAVMGNMPLMAGGILVGMFALAFIYAKGYEGGPGLVEGLRFGGILGTFMVAGIWIGNYATLNVGRKIAVEGAVAAFVEMLIVGAVLGALYKPATVARPARV
jgi:hypothetical protein